jgi:antitoxin ParD1/3/4
MVRSSFLDKEGNMHISLTPELEIKVKQKVASGFYNNASEVIRDALRFWEKNEELVQHMKLQLLKERLAIGADQAKQGEFLAQSVTEIIAEVRNA